MHIIGKLEDGGTLVKIDTDVYKELKAIEDVIQDGLRLIQELSGRFAFAESPAAEAAAALNQVIKENKEKPEKSPRRAKRMAPVVSIKNTSGKSNRQIAVEILREKPEGLSTADLYAAINKAGGKVASPTSVGVMLCSYKIDFVAVGKVENSPSKLYSVTKKHQLSTLFKSELSSGDALTIDAAPTQLTADGRAKRLALLKKLNQQLIDKENE